MGSGSSSPEPQEKEPTCCQHIRLNFSQNLGICSREIHIEQSVESLKRMLIRDQDFRKAIFECKKEILEDNKKITDYIQSNSLQNNSTIKISSCETPISTSEKRLFLEFSKNKRPTLIIYAENQSLTSFTEQIHKITRIPKINQVIFYKNKEINEKILRSLSNDSTVQVKKGLLKMIFHILFFF